MGLFTSIFNKTSYEAVRRFTPANYAFNKLFIVISHNYQVMDYIAYIYKYKSVVKI